MRTKVAMMIAMTVVLVALVEEAGEEVVTVSCRRCAAHARGSPV